MKGENNKFNFTDIMKSNGKVYYKKSEDTYKKINSLKDIKGINSDIAKGGLINLVKELARTFSFLQKSEVLSEDEKLD